MPSEQDWDRPSQPPDPEPAAPLEAGTMMTRQEFVRSLGLATAGVGGAVELVSISRRDRAPRDPVGPDTVRTLPKPEDLPAAVIHSGTGATHPGIATYVPVRDYHGHEPATLREGFPLAMITHRTISQTESRTVADPWLSPLMPENRALINPVDARQLGLSDGQLVKVVSATNPTGEHDPGPDFRVAMIGKVQFTETMRPGVKSFALGFGHWATGAYDVEINGEVVPGEKRRQAGLHANAAMWVDPALQNTCFLDPVGGSVSFYDTFVNLVPA